VTKTRLMYLLIVASLFALQFACSPWSPWGLGEGRF
jgi:hypothetical protein